MTDPFTKGERALRLTPTFLLPINLLNILTVDTNNKDSMPPKDFGYPYGEEIPTAIL